MEGGDFTSTVNVQNVTKHNTTKHSNVTLSRRKWGGGWVEKIKKTEKAGLLRMHRTFRVKLLNFKLRHSNDCCALIGLAVSWEHLVSNPGFFAYP